MNEQVKKYCWDILSAIDRMEKATEKISFEQFKQDYFLVNGIERNFEIIGEALKKALETDATLNISDTKKIIGMRNIIAHNYDLVEPINLWGTIRKNIPVLKKEIQLILESKN